MTDDDPERRQPTGRHPHQFLLAEHADPGSGTRLAGEAVEVADRLGPADAVDRQAAVALEPLERPGGQRSEDPVDLPAVEPEPAEAGLEVGDVVAAQVG